MNKFVLIRNDDGAFVAGPGCESSYCKIIGNARKFDSREAAEAERCGNEHIASVEDVVNKEGRL